MSTFPIFPALLGQRRWLRSIQPVILIGSLLLLSIVVMAITAPWLYTIDPNAMDPTQSHLPPGALAEFTTLAGDSFHRFFPLGTDAMGRDLWSRAAYGARVSLGIGMIVAIAAVAPGVGRDTACAVLAAMLLYRRRPNDPVAALLSIGLVGMVSGGALFLLGVLESAPPL